MTSRERVQATLRHEEPDHIPLDLGGNQTGIHRIAYEALLARLGREEEVTVMDAVQQLAAPSEEVLDLLGVDTRYVAAGAAEGAEPRFAEETIRGEPYLSMTDEFGIVWSMPRKGGLYHDITHSPLADARTVADIEAHPWPDGGDPSRFAGLAETAAQMRRTTGKAICTGISGVVYEFCWYMMGFARFYEALAAEPHLVEAMLDHMLAYWLDFEAGFLDAVGPYVDVVMVGDDLAGQQGTLLSPEMYRRLVKPRHAKLYEFIHSKTDAKLWYHSCGAVRELLPDLIEIGVEIINPVQVSAQGMNTAELKREFGESLTFWGGGCDTQHVLPHGTPEEVRAEVQQRCSDLAPGGGFVFTAVHNIQPDVPPENVLAMYEEAREWRG
jgi:uroporphyrinogen decarboxylase